MSDVCKGIVIGAGSALATATAFGLHAHVEGRLFPTAEWGALGAVNAISLFAFIGVPIGMLFGGLLGSMTASVAHHRGWVRSGLYVFVSLLALAWLAPLWPALMPYAIPCTIVHALALARWTQPRTRSANRLDPCRLAMTRGALLGASNGVVIALVFAFAATGGCVFYRHHVIGVPWFVDRDPLTWQTFLAIAMHGVPFGILWGVLIGYIAHQVEGGWLIRGGTVMIVAVVAMGFTAIPWDEVLPIGCGSTIFHALVLVRWTVRDRDPLLPRARVRR